MDVGVHALQLQFEPTNKYSHSVNNNIETTSSDSTLSEYGNVAKARRLDYEDPPSNTATSPVVEHAKICVPNTWSVSDASNLYNLPGWSENYFLIDEQGHLCACPIPGTDMHALNLHEMTRTLASRDLRTPVMFRFLDIVADRLRKINTAFATAISRQSYGGAYRGVFPVKCNHDKDLLKFIVEQGEPYGYGLEVGSKPELAMVMSLLANTAPGSRTVICNGYKDSEYMELALHSRQLGINTIVVMEQYSELDLILNASKKLNVSPVIGIRAKLSTRHDSHWGPTSGDKAKFGLRVPEIVSLVKRLASCGCLEHLQLLHFHCGSQITNIRTVKEVMSEATQLFAELYKMGANMKYIDVGGGLAVDYDGSFTDTHASMSYNLAQYAHDVVGAMQSVCIAKGIPPPTIISESGRALVSHHAVLVFDVLNPPNESFNHTNMSSLVGAVAPTRSMSLTALTAAMLDAQKPEGAKAALFGNNNNNGFVVDCDSAMETSSEDSEENKPTAAPLHIDNTNNVDCSDEDGSSTEKGRLLIASMHGVMRMIEPDSHSLRAAAADAGYLREEALRAFKVGAISLEERAHVEELYDSSISLIASTVHCHGLALPDALAATLSSGGTRMYHVNMSVFRSAVDSWAIQQLFPIMPIHRLNEEPTVEATLADLTCDSDGKIDRFINPKGGEPLHSLPLHEVRSNEPYYLAMFLTGAYQEVMGSVHNMFGGVHTVNIRSDTSTGIMSSSHASSAVPADWNQTAGSVLTVDDLKKRLAAVSANATPFVNASIAEVQEKQQQCNVNYIFDGVVTGETTGQVLARVNHQASHMIHRVRETVDVALQEGRLNVEEAAVLMNCYFKTMSGYTYMA